MFHSSLTKAGLEEKLKFEPDPVQTEPVGSDRIRSDPVQTDPVGSGSEPDPVGSGSTGGSG